jgi:hypothetical protein
MADKVKEPNFDTYLVKHLRIYSEWCVLSVDPRTTPYWHIFERDWTKVAGHIPARISDVSSWDAEIIF